ncbi:MAG: RagB/SusD family nutrient uptake outer membrane protein [Candidatus Saccharimonadaceae bacterium]
MKKYLLLLITILFISVSCNDSYLEKYPKTSLTEENAFESYDNFKAFIFPCYAMFTDNRIANSVTAGFAQDANHRGDFLAGYFSQRFNYNPYAFQTIENVSSGNGWDFEYIRRINIMLSNLGKGKLAEAEENHWKAVGYFFHSYWYMELINRFGDVPYVEQVLNESSPEAFGPREDRKIVADKVIEKLKWAEANIGDFKSKDGENTINKDVIQAAMSRFTLREATWRKYHKLGDFDKYFTECVRVSNELMGKYPTLYTGTDGQPAAGYGEMWTTEDLGQVPGVIFYKQFIKAVLTNNNNHVEHTSSHIVEMPQNTVDLYLCKDGKTISNSPLYNGDKDIYSTYRNRDPRMYHLVMPPFRVNPVKGDYPTWSFTANPADREYIDIMGRNESCSNPGVGMKRLPAQNWGATLLAYAPNLQNGIAAQGTKAAAFVAGRTGYYVWKSWNQWEENFNQGALNTSDKPIFKIEEVLLNYAEAKFEQGEFNQSVADASINKLRQRASVANMLVASIDNNFDLKRDPSVDPVLWEVRRERTIELMGEGFGFDDIRRWKVAPWFINKQQLGMWIQGSKTTESLWDKNTHLPTKNIAEGYIYLWADPLLEGKGWLDKYYLYQVPTDQIVLNPAIKQNPGY